MAFSHSRVLRIVSKYSQELENAYTIEPSKMIYNPDRYGFQYSNKLTKEGYEKGAKFLNRIPKYRETHPEILDTLKSQRLIMLYSIIGILAFSGFLRKERNEQDREMTFQLLKDREYVGRYAYKQLDVEYLPRSNPPFPV
ncbi:hypothetical protein SteCoe_475 [Stentor coeruleus]|uniref:Uncharacterized protein n=1 Tax=Stentor coeruleus TaxID=5963 RepID=A0A1R2D495_9CILI|nr:hypothetical protein SteCoe_475 [Stentor coeruleus]